MYYNVLTFTNGKTIPFTSETPFSIDKLDNEFIVITDSKTGEIFSFRSSEVVTIASQLWEKIEAMAKKKQAESVPKPRKTGSNKKPKNFTINK